MLDSDEPFIPEDEDEYKRLLPGFLDLVCISTALDGRDIGLSFSLGILRSKGKWNSTFRDNDHMASDEFVVSVFAFDTQEEALAHLCLVEEVLRRFMKMNGRRFVNIYSPN